MLFLRPAQPKGLMLMPVNNVVNTDAFIPERSHLSGPRRENKYWWSGKRRGRVIKQRGSRLQMESCNYRPTGLNPKPS